MSSLYKKYISLKKQDSTKYYLFKSGFFYIFLNEDARTMSNILHLKLGNLNATVVKCGFPETSLNKYIALLRNLNYEVFIVPSINSEEVATTCDYAKFTSLKSISLEFCNIDIDNLSISEAFNVISVYQKKINFILENEVHNNE